MTVNDEGSADFRSKNRLSANKNLLSWAVLSSDKRTATERPWLQELRELPPPALASLRCQMGHSVSCSNQGSSTTVGRVEPLLVLDSLSKSEQPDSGTTRVGKEHLRLHRLRWVVGPLTNP
jgi:hypothetical protein